MAKIGALTDDFTAATPAVWSYGAETSFAGGQATITPTAAYGGLRTVSRYDLTGSAVTVEVLQLASGTPATAVETIVRLTTVTGGILEIVCTATALQGSWTVGGSRSWGGWSQATVSQMRYWRIRESGGTVFLEYSGTGQLWSLLHSLPAPFDVTSVRLEILAGVWDPATTAFIPAVYGSVNVLPEVGLVLDRWTGSALVRLRTDRWDGATLTRLTSEIAHPTEGPPNPAGWRVVFEDDFNGTSLNTAAWQPYWYATNGTMNNVTTSSGNVSVANSELVLTLASTTSGALVHTDIATGYKMPVGDYVEARVRYPGNGTQLYNWSAWWATTQVSEGWPAAGEHDIAEILDGNLDIVYHGPGVDTTSPRPAGYWGDAFHVYGLHRKAGTADVYYDGIKVATYATPDSGNPIILVLNIGRTNGTNPTVTGASGAVRVDWVRAWRPV